MKNQTTHKAFGFRVLKVIVLLLLTLITLKKNQAQAAETAPRIDNNDDRCNVPTYAVGGKNVTSPDISDGSIYISGIEDATHYEILQGNGTPFDFSESTALNANQVRVDINGLANPTIDLAFKVRLYNGTETCYTDQSVHLAHINFAESLNYTKLEVTQGIDNPLPQVGDIVTFTTTVTNKGVKPATNIELKQFYSTSLEVVYSDANIGTFSTVTNTWEIGDLKGGTQPVLIIRARVMEEGLSYLTSFFSRANNFSMLYGDPLPTQGTDHPITATSCVSIPIQMKLNDVYTVTLQNYENLTWYHKDVAGNFSEINEFTDASIAEINADSSLSIKQGGEFTYTREVGNCIYNSCCSIMTENCKGPGIVVDSVYCNTNVDSYSMLVHLENKEWSIVERVYYALSNLSFPVLTNFLRRLNVLPLTASAGYVTSLGSGYYKIENIPSFRPNVTLVSSDISGECRTIKIVNSPDCGIAALASPILASNLEFFSPGQMMPALRIENPQKRGIRTIWYEDELGTRVIGKGDFYRPETIGDYFVAFVDKKTGSRSHLAAAEIKDLTINIPGDFVNLNICDCKNPVLLPSGVKEEYTVATIFPNPVRDLLNIEYMMPDKALSADIFVFNIAGRQMGSYAIDLNKESTSINVIRWPDGLYVLTMVVDGEKKVTQRFVVRH